MSLVKERSHHFFIITGTLIFLMFTGFFITSTNKGLQTTAYVVEKLIPGNLEIDQVQGKLISEIKLSGINYQNAKNNIQVDSLSLHWDLSKLFKNKIIIKDLKINQITIDLNSKPTSEKNINLSNYKELSRFAIQNLTVSQLSIYQNGKLLTNIDNIIIKKEKNGLRDFVIKSEMGEMNGKVKLTLFPILSWNVDINAKQFNPGRLFKSWDGNINLKMVSDGEWTANLHKINLDINSLTGTLRNLPLAGTAKIHTQNNRIEIQPATFTLGKTALQISGLINDQLHLRWDLTIPQMENVIPNAKGMLMTHGTLNGTMERPEINANLIVQDLSVNGIKITKAKGTATTELGINPLSSINLTLDNLNVKDYRFKLVNCNIQSQLIDKMLNAKILLSLNTHSQLQANLSFPQFDLTNASQPINGNINFNLAELKDIALPNVDHLQGDFIGKINLKGAVNNPSINTDLKITGGSFSVPKFGVNVKNVELKGTSEKLQALAISGKFLSGTGQGQIQGNINLFHAPFNMNLNLTGTNLQIVNLKEYKINANPNLQITYNNNTFNLAGKLFIPYTLIQTSSIDNVVSLPDEVVFVDQKKQTNSTTPTDLAMNIQVDLGENISVSYEKLQTKLAGSVLIKQQPGRLATGIGELRMVKGKYEVYGKTLKIKVGRLIYTGNLLTNPGIDIEANKKITKVSVIDGGASQFNSSLGKTNSMPVYNGTDTVQVGVSVKGTINQPNVSLTSDPAMSQDDILSYLYFGYPRSQITAGSSLAILNSLAANMKTGSKNNIGDITNKIQNTLGLSQLSLGSTSYYMPDQQKEGTATTVNIGKKIGDKLTINYSKGINNSLSVFSVKYQINKHFAVQSQSNSVDNGADILYEYERD